MKKETLIYIVSTTNAYGEPYAFNLKDIQNMSDEEFIETAEEQDVNIFLCGTSNHILTNLSLSPVAKPCLAMQLLSIGRFF